MTRHVAAIGIALAVTATLSAAPAWAMADRAGSSRSAITEPRQLVCDVTSRAAERYGATIEGGSQSKYTMRLLFEDGVENAVVIFVSKKPDGTIDEQTQQAHFKATPTRITFNWERFGKDDFSVGVDRQTLALFGGSPDERVSGTCRVGPAPKRQI